MSIRLKHEIQKEKRYPWRMKERQPVGIRQEEGAQDS